MANYNFSFDIMELYYLRRIEQLLLDNESLKKRIEMYEIKKA